MGKYTVLPLCPRPAMAVTNVTLPILTLTGNLEINFLLLISASSYRAIIYRQKVFVLYFFLEVMPEHDLSKVLSRFLICRSPPSARREETHELSHVTI
jgi:hypothetical protein